MRVNKPRSIVGSIAIVLLSQAVAAAAWTNNIMLTGYWTPTNDMLVPFSTNLELNPSGWQGQNWQNTGYDVYSYFPVFEPRDSKGTGDFEVDYQDTSEDFWRIVEEIHPVAILSYGQGNGPWELEYNAVNHSVWSSDYEAPTWPSPNPIDGSVPAGYVRQSTLPLQEIADAINQSGLGVNAWIDWTGDPGNFLCNYMAYHDAWYQSLHSDPSDPYQCFAAGFTHVGSGVTLEQAIAASDITLLTTMDYLDTCTAIPEPSTRLLSIVGSAWMFMCFRRKRTSA